MSKGKDNKRNKVKRGLALRVSPLRLMLFLYALFVVLYVLVIGSRYGAVFRIHL